MEITEVKIFPTDDEHLRALFSITIDNCFMIRGLKIIRGPKGHFIDMPSKRRKGEDRREIVSAISAETRQMLEEKVFAEYEKITGEPLNRRKLTKS